MKVLGIETTSKICSVAVLENENLAAEYILNIKGRHSEKLFSGLNKILTDLGIKIKDLEGIGVSIGPGSFTGIRVGISAVRGLAQALKIPIVGVSSLDILALSVFPCDFFVCPIIDALRKEVYTALYRTKVTEKIMEYQLIKIEELLKNLYEFNQRHQGKILFVGDGVSLHREIIKNMLGKKAVFASFRNVFPTASNVAWLGKEELQRGKGKKYNKIFPLYIRRPTAELGLKK
ncbi:tRNA (adenosine(37)-N6)-threonylcarbamoyltransferase complex dimerization subunit type 1 TsaB [bacterium]|nr:tRNA (adenosine(37)-N6)-threonylcarbamoyltransferase complex dimerization subunit type 1 TsaB [bacterium]